MRKGFVHIYTGNGKGKTTAALGLALRSAGAGHRVYIAQFIKARRCSEHKILERLSDLITIRLYGNGLILGREANSKDISAARKGIEESKEAMMSGEYDLIILDEANVAVAKKLLGVDELIEFVNTKPDKVELVITGRYAEESLLQLADLVTEMREIRHYSEKGVQARVGIEE